MAVKDKIGRKRYIAFEITAPRAVQKSEVIRLIRTSFGGLVKDINPWLVKYKRNKGLLRCAHTKKEAVIKLLSSIKNINGMEIEIKTLGTSGTIKCATRKYFRT